MDDGQRQRAAELHEQGLGCNAIANAMGVDPSTISRWAAKEGLTFDRAKTSKAVRARVVDIADRRQRLTGRVYDMLERALDRAEYPPEGGWTTVIRSKGGAEQIVTVRELPLRDLRDLGYTVNTLSYAAAALERANALHTANENLDASKSMLGQLAAAFGISSPEPTPA